MSQLEDEDRSIKYVVGENQTNYEVPWTLFRPEDLKIYQSDNGVDGWERFDPAAYSYDAENREAIFVNAPDEGKFLLVRDEVMIPRRPWEWPSNEPITAAALNLEADRLSAGVLDNRRDIEGFLYGQAPFYEPRAPIGIYYHGLHWDRQGAVTPDETLVRWIATRDYFFYPNLKYGVDGSAIGNFARLDAPAPADFTVDIKRGGATIATLSFLEDETEATVFGNNPDVPAIAISGGDELVFVTSADTDPATNGLKFALVFKDR